MWAKDREKPPLTYSWRAPVAAAAAQEGKEGGAGGEDRRAVGAVAGMLNEMSVGRRARPTKPSLRSRTRVKATMGLAPQKSRGTTRTPVLGSLLACSTATSTTLPLSFFSLSVVFPRCPSLQSCSCFRSDNLVTLLAFHSFEDLLPCRSLSASN